MGDRARLRSGIQKLNAELKSLLAIDPGNSGFLLPADQVKVVPDPIDADQAVQAGLLRRNDLNLLRALAGMADHRTTPAIRRVLIGLTPVLGAVVSQSAGDVPLMPFVSSMAKAESASVRRQLQSLLQDREREAAKEIRTAVEEWGTARDLVVIARKKFELGQERVTDFEKRQKVGQGVELDLRKARLELLQSEADLIGEIIKWKLADVKAREAIGLLCGDEGCGK
jgi:outer membrane protein TolC